MRPSIVTATCFLALTACEEVLNVSGVANIIRVTSSGEVVTPQDIDEFRVYALVPNGEGGFDGYDGNGKTDGTFEIPGVPAGNFYLRVGTSLYYSDHRTFDLSVVTLGRPRFIADAGSELELDLDNLAEWREGDVLGFYSVNGGCRNGFQYAAVRGAPVPGDRSLRGMAVDFATIALPVFEAEKGDSATLLQLSSTSSTGATQISSATRRHELSGLTMANGAVTSASGAFTEIPHTERVTLEYDPEKYAAFTSLAGPNAEPAGFVEASLVGVPHTAEHGLYSRGLDIARYFSTTQTSTRATITFGDALSGVDHWLTYDYLYFVPVAEEHVISARMSTTRPLMPGDQTFQLEPVISPVRDVQVAGRSGYTGGSGVGAVPVISWTAPELGVPSRYHVELVRLDNFGEIFEAEWHTSRTEVQIAPGLMHAGRKYFFRIGASTDPSFDIARPHSVSPSGRSRAEMVTAVFEP